MSKRILVLGAGASGYAAAIEAARLGADVLLLDAQQKTCRKVLSSGNGRCNLTAKGVDVTHYITHDPALLAPILAQSSEVDAFLRSVGIAVRYDDAGRGYPQSNRAQSVADALQLHAVHSGVQVVTGFVVRSLGATAHGYRVVALDGRFYEAPCVIVALGSAASPQLGGTDVGLALAKQLGLAIYPQRLSLVPLRVKRPIPSLKGCRVECVANIAGKAGVLSTQSGEVLFADYGLSGIAVMQLSAYYEEGATLSLDLFPSMDLTSLCDLLRSRRDGGAYPTLDKWLVGLLDRPIAYAVLKAAMLSPLDLPTRQVDNEGLVRLARVLKDWRFAVEGPLGAEFAQVCLGGVGLAQLRDWQCDKAPAVYWCGEVLDVTGECGGFNLHWAWLSGVLAARQAATQSNPKV